MKQKADPDLGDKRTSLRGGLGPHPQAQKILKLRGSEMLFQAFSLKIFPQKNGKGQNGKTI